jgi:WhiB family transcriptional regulator, redox-sensing transcriptional regulator
VTAAATPSWPESQAGFWSWQMEAACRAVSPSLFYSPEGERGARKAVRERAAKAVCASCEVVEVCAAYAIACREPYGTWGGLSERDRETAYPRVDPVQAQAAYRRALAIWQERLLLPRPRERLRSRIPARGAPAQQPFGMAVAFFSGRSGPGRSTATGRAGGSRLRTEPSSQ